MENVSTQQESIDLTKVKHDSPENSPERVVAISSLLENIDEVGQDASAKKLKQTKYEDKLARNRLGIASSLFLALRAKHAPTASHSLRVALGASSWSMALGQTEQVRDRLELTGLLHDVGKIGIPDQILTKPGKLLPEEISTLEMHRQIGYEIIGVCCTSKELLDIFRHIGVRFERNHETDKPEDVPLEARMLSIVDAFDSMTTDHIYRRAMSRDRAMAELYANAGTQFDPELVDSFCRHVSRNDLKLHAGVMSRWLNELARKEPGLTWSVNRMEINAVSQSVDRLFQQKLVDAMRDGVIFVDSRQKVMLWNVAAEKLTGIVSSSVFEKQWLPSLVEWRDENDVPVSDVDCPIAKATQLGEPTFMRGNIRGRGQQRVMIDMQVNPVVAPDSVVHGATIILHDASSQVTLEERVEALHTKATQDPLTKIANRAEFDRVLKEFVATHIAEQIPCSLIICDLDFFKRINDDYGHQAGDEALMSFASLLKRFHRAGDLVARYGGEEFVMLCAGADNVAATERAEEVRRVLEETPQPALDNKSLTASFGVTELQNGDTPDTMLRRADRALQQAKEQGRNRVAQLGAGLSQEEDPQEKSGLLRWLKPLKKEELSAVQLLSPVPLDIVVEKLRGFVADQQAQIIKVEGNSVSVKIDGCAVGNLRRRGDRPVPFLVELDFCTAPVKDGAQHARTKGTLILVSISPIRSRDRRLTDLHERCSVLLSSIKSYFVATTLESKPKIEPAADSPGRR